MFSVELDVECVGQRYLEIMLEEKLSDRGNPRWGEICDVDGQIFEKRNAESGFALHAFDVKYDQSACFAV